MSSAVPAHAQVVIVGGGIAGVSTAYHLTKLGCSDVVLLEQGKLTCGTTWHAAGLVGQLRATRNATRMSRYGIELYASLEAGDRARHRLEAMRQPQRRQDAGAAEAAEAADGAGAKASASNSSSSRPAKPDAIYPMLRTDDLARRRLDSRRRQGQPDRPDAIARQRRAHARRAHRRRRDGDRRHRRARQRRRRALSRRATAKARSAARAWSIARASGRASSASSPASTYRCSPPSISTSSPSRSPACIRDLPVMRDPDGFIYYKEEVGGLVMGGFEPVAKPWDVAGDSRPLRIPAAARGLGPVRDPDDATRSIARRASKRRK